MQKLRSELEGAQKTNQTAQEYQKTLEKSVAERSKELAKEHDRIRQHEL